MKKIIYFIFILSLLSCSNKIECKKISIEYNDNIVLDTTSYISIDSKIIKHTRNNQLIRYKKALPADYIRMFNTKNSIVIKSDKKIIVEKLRQILNQSQLYKFDSLQYLDITDRLILSRKDNKNLSIYFSKNYSAKIKCVK